MPQRKVVNMDIKNTHGERVGVFRGDEVYTASGNRIGQFRGDDFYTASCDRIGQLRGDDFYTASGDRIGQLRGNEIYTASGNRVGWVDGSPSKIQVGAAGLALLSSLLDNSGSSGSVVMPSFSGGGGSSSGEDNFFIRTFIKNPIGLTVLGVLATAIIGPILYDVAGNIAGFVVGVIITAVGILWLVLRNKNLKRFMDSNMPIYSHIIELMQKSGYKVEESLRKKNEVRTEVYQNGKRLGQIFLHAPPPYFDYAGKMRAYDLLQEMFNSNYRKKFGREPEIPLGYWTDNSLIGAHIDPSAEDCAEKEKWLSAFANLFHE